MKVIRKNHPTPLSIVQANTPRWKQMMKTPSRRAPLQAIPLFLSFLCLMCSGWACCVMLYLLRNMYQHFNQIPTSIYWNHAIKRSRHEYVLLINHGREPGWTRNISECGHRIITTVSHNWRVSISLFLNRSRLTPTYSAPFNEERTNKLLETLPSITEKELEKLGHKGNIVLSFHVISAISLLKIDSVCSVCMQSFLAILAEEESASVMVSPAFFSGELGVTQLNQPWQCGHLFCRRELRIFSIKLSETNWLIRSLASVTKWIKTGVSFFTSVLTYLSLLTRLIFRNLPVLCVVRVS